VTCISNKIDYFSRIIFNGFSQIMLQENAITGMLFLLGIFYNSVAMGTGALLGVLAGTSTAFIFRYSKKDIQRGLYGFNGALAGIGIILFFGFNASSVVLVIL